MLFGESCQGLGHQGGEADIRGPHLKGILGNTEDQVVSFIRYDFNSDTHSSTLCVTGAGKALI